MNKVCILDYGSGNVKSVYNLLKSISSDVIISNSKSDIENASHIILPGVGAFGTAMQKMKNTLPLDLLEREIVRNEKPFLGICVGMQVLAERGYEFGEHVGLGWIKGNVNKLYTTSEPLPHIGWNDIVCHIKSPILKDLEDGEDFYFVHSYVFSASNNDNVLATTTYGNPFPCIVSNNNIFGVQFHPEKSQQAGQIIIRNFLSIE